MLKIKLITTISLLLFSFFGNKTIAFLKQCEKVRVENNSLYYYSTSTELKKEIPKNDILFYLGSDETHHYLKYHYRPGYLSYDKTHRWAVMSFKIPIDNMLPIPSESYPISDDEPREIKMNQLE